ncbi:MAG TPA: hypothetical protein VN944_04900 [Nitrospiria bacterium]|nr:hypothetical protein [Nitrospiria bacterium]
MNRILKSQLEQYKEKSVARLIETFFKENDAGGAWLKIVEETGEPLVLDHFAIRCLDIDKRAKEFISMGFVNKKEIIEYPEQGWWAKVYRKKGYPALFIDQDYTGRAVNSSPLTPWVKKFGDQALHHVAVRVPGIDKAKALLVQKGIEFSGEIIGPPGTRLRQIFSAAEVRDGSAYTVLELAERNNYDGFYPEQADGLMKSSVKTKSISAR